MFFGYQGVLKEQLTQKYSCTHPHIVPNSYAGIFPEGLKRRISIKSSCIFIVTVSVKLQKENKNNIKITAYAFRTSYVGSELRTEFSFLDVMFL